jgi:hypothetical protein
MITDIKIGGKKEDGSYTLFVSDGELISSVSDDNAAAIRRDLRDIRS